MLMQNDTIVVTDNHKDTLADFLRARCISPDTAARFGLRYEHYAGRAAIVYPVLSADGQAAARGRVKFLDKRGQKYAWSGSTDAAPPRFFNLSALAGCDGVIVLATEIDVMALHSAGIPALGWFGEASIPRELPDALALAGVHTAVIYPDADRTGYESAAKLRAMLGTVGIRLDARALPFEFGSKKDIGDYRRQFADAADFRAALAALPAAELPSIAVAQSAQRDVYPDVSRLNSDLRAIDSLRESPITDAGAAENLVALFGGDLRYVPGVGWLVWNCVNWQHDEQSIITTYALAGARARQFAAARALAEVQAATMPGGVTLTDSAILGVTREQKEKEAAAQKALNAAVRMESARALSSAISIAQALPAFVVGARYLDQQDALLACENGVVDLVNGTLHAGQRADLITKNTGVAFDTHARADRWQRFIHEIFNDDTLEDWIQRAVGYSASGATHEQIFFLLHGTGANGKSVFLSALRGALGDYALNTPFSTFEQQHASTATNDVAALRAARFVTSSEAEDGTRLNEARVKALTGDNAITARLLYREYVTFRPTAKIWLAANHKPVVRGTDYAMWRRVRLIPFLRTFAGADADASLEQTLVGERAGILAWIVKGASEYARRGLADIPACVRAATDDYRADSDIVGLFLSECCELAPAASCGAWELYTAYKEWTQAQGLGTLSNVRLARDLEQRGISKQRSMRGVMYQGVSVVDTN